MAKTYTVVAEGWDGYDYETTLTLPNRSGSATLAAESQYIEIGDFSGDGTRQPGLQARPCALSVVNTSDLTPLDNIDEDEVVVDVTRVQTGNVVWKGYLKPSQVENTPLSPTPDQVTLQCTEGFGTLDSQSFGDFSFATDQEITLQKALVNCIKSISDINITVLLAMDWYPETSSLSSTDSPLLNVWHDPEMWRDDRADETGWLSKKDVLEEILESIGCQLFQTKVIGELRWFVRNAQSANTSGEMPAWEISEAASISFGQTDFSVDLQPAIDNDRMSIEHVGDYERARNETIFTYDHLPVPNYLREGGLENSGVYWTFTDNNKIRGRASLHKSHSETPASRSGNRRVMEIRLDADNVTNTEKVVGAKQDFDLLEPDKEDGIQLTWSDWRNSDFTGRFRIQFGSYYVAGYLSSISGGKYPQGNVVLQVDPLSVPVLEGSTLSILTSGDNDKFEVTERASVGDTQVRGRLSREIDTSNGWDLRYYGLLSSTSNINLNFFVSPDRQDSWGARGLRFPYQDGNGNTPSTSTGTIEIIGQSPASGFVRWYLDNIKLQPIKNGQVLDESVYTATVDSPGKSDESDSRLGSGPAETQLSRTRGTINYGDSFPIDQWLFSDQLRVSGDATTAFSVGDKVDLVRQDLNTVRHKIRSISYDSVADQTDIQFETDVANSSSTNGSVKGNVQSQYNTFFWGVGANPSTTYPLGELFARQRLRYHRSPNRRLELTEYLRDNSTDLFGHEIVEAEGRLWTVESIRTRPQLAEGTREVTLLELKDYGTA